MAPSMSLQMRLKSILKLTRLLLAGNRGTAHHETARTKPHERKTARADFYTRFFSGAPNQELHNYYRGFSSVMLRLISKQAGDVNRDKDKRMTNIFKGDKTFTRPVNWITSFFMIAFHIGAVVALFMFGWKPFLLAIFLWWVAGSLGVGMGYHRLLTHRGYKTPKFVEYFLTTCATLALEGGPIFWVATHRMP